MIYQFLHGGKQLESIARGFHFSMTLIRDKTSRSLMPFFCIKCPYSKCHGLAAKPNRLTHILKMIKLEISIYDSVVLGSNKRLAERENQATLFLQRYVLSLLKNRRRALCDSMSTSHYFY